MWQRGSRSMEKTAAMFSGHGVGYTGVNPDSFTDVTYSHARRRRGNVCFTLVFGFLLFVAAFPLLWWNEGNAVAVYSSLEEARQAVVPLLEPTATSSTKGKLLHITGITTGDDMSDTEFGFELKNLVKLTRKTEMYQWVEKKHERRIKEGNQQRKEVTYTYSKEWREGVVNSARFHSPEGHENPQGSGLESYSRSADEVGVGNGFVLAPVLASELRGTQKVRLVPQGSREALGGTTVNRGARSDQLPKKGKGIIDEDEDEDEDDGSAGRVARLGPVSTVPSELPSGYALSNGEAYSRLAAASTPQVGDVRVRFNALPGGQTVSVLAQQGKNGRLQPFKAKSGKEVAMVYSGKVSAKRMIRAAEKKNEFQTWFLRGAGFVMMMVGTMMITSAVGYITQYLGYLPLLGGMLAYLINLGLCIAGIAVSISGSLLVIGTSWLFHRPVMAITMLATSGAIAVGTYMLQEKKNAAPSSGRDEGIPLAPPAEDEKSTTGQPDYRKAARAAAAARMTGGHLD